VSQADLFRDGQTPTSPRVMTVAELVRAANRCLEHTIATVWVEGEVSNLKLAASGHAFFTLKDDQAALPIAMWRTALQRLRFRLEEGQHLRILGRLGIYAAQGRFQLYAERAEPVGVGALMLALEQRKAKLAKEGLFAQERKRPLPVWPRIVGVVTSLHGAVVHDIVEVARRRCPTRIVIAPALVQGQDAPASLVRALERLQRMPGVDVIILGRGGGSSEDLWAFNDETVARAVAACAVPVVAAIGHEVDVTICDLVADLRAATPSHAAELVVPDRDGHTREMKTMARRLILAMQRTVIDRRNRVEQLDHRLGACGRGFTRMRWDRLNRLYRRIGQHHPRARLARDRSQLDALRTALLQRGQTLVRSPRIRLARAAGALQALSPLAVLERGYALVLDQHDVVVRDAGRVELGTELGVVLYRGKLRVRVTARTPESGSES